ncbi:MAG: Hpt domain-containing protein [Treponema sp.]|nr:Hpt domain-containing protein [Treponema sp.]
MPASSSEIYDKKSALDLLDGDEDLLNILIDSFIEENKFRQDHLEKLLELEKFSEAASYVHATKGAARQLCMTKLKNSGQELEDVLRGKKKGELPPLVKKMLADYEEAVKVVKF